MLATVADTYNAIEPYIWYVVALGVIPALRGHAALRPRITLAGLLALFGTSDFFEHDGWWTPWWLLTWKAGSLLLIAFVSYRILRGARRAARDTFS